MSMTLQLLDGLSPAGGPLAEVQRRGRNALLDLPVPHRGMESWRFVDAERLNALLGQQAVAGADARGTGPAADPALPPPAAGTHRLLLSGGPEPPQVGTLPEGLELLSGAELQQHLGHTLAATGCEHHWPVELNHAAARHCLALRVHGSVRDTLEIVSLPGRSGVWAPRLLLILEKHARLCLQQVVLGRGSSLSSVVVEAHLGRDARLEHALIALDDGAAGLLADVAVEQEPSSSYRGTSVLRGWRLARFEPRVHQVGGGAETRLRGLQVADDASEIDSHCLVRFGGPDGSLDQLHKAIADGRGHSIFNGAVQVPRQAQKTEAAQLSRSLLLSPRARIDTKPQLEIVADDVRCTHGATVSSLRQEELFYLRSRGVDAATAASLLKRGYCQDILDELPAAAAPWSLLERVLAPAQAAAPTSTSRA